MQLVQAFTQITSEYLFKTSVPSPSKKKRKMALVVSMTNLVSEGGSHKGQIQLKYLLKTPCPHLLELLNENRRNCRRNLSQIIPGNHRYSVLWENLAVWQDYLHGDVLKAKVFLKVSYNAVL